MNKYHRLFLHYAERHPKKSTAILTGATCISLVAMVVFIEMRDARDARRRSEAMKRLGLAEETDSEVKSTNYLERMNNPTTLQEAQLKAMVENAKKSSWKENLENAVDAHSRFMLPGIAGKGEDTPEYVKKIDERSEEILRKQEEKKEQERRLEQDPTRTKFWR
mmetsp:Transcript_21595/g.45168  ORF Transcript_21595/g.45168 Transcript_21595/m.45168 type:complete len:164 (+) Transcript_21595:82-573(+)